MLLCVSIFNCLLLPSDTQFCHSLFIHSPVDGQLGCFQIWIITNKATMNMCVQLFLWTSHFALLLSKYLGGGWLVSLVGIYFTFTFSKAVAVFYIPEAVYENSGSSTSLLTLGTVFLILAISHLSFNLNSLMTNDVEHLSHAYLPSIYLE